MCSVNHLGLETSAPDVLHIPKTFNDYVVKYNNIYDKDFFLCFTLILFFSIQRSFKEQHFYWLYLKKKLTLVYLIYFGESLR